MYLILSETITFCPKSGAEKNAFFYKKRSLQSLLILATSGLSETVTKTSSPICPVGSYTWLFQPIISPLKSHHVAQHEFMYTIFKLKRTWCMSQHWYMLLCFFSDLWAMCSFNTFFTDKISTTLMCALCHPASYSLIFLNYYVFTNISLVPGIDKHLLCSQHCCP